VRDCGRPAVIAIEKELAREAEEKRVPTKVSVCEEHREGNFDDWRIVFAPEE
jgi:hypothetical protein